MQKLLLASVLTIALAGCQSTSEEPYLECNFGGQYTDVAAPQWVCGSANTDPAKYTVQAMGLSANQAGGLSHQRQLAILDASRTLAAQFSSKIVASIKNSTSTLGVDGNAGGVGASKDIAEALVDFELVGMEITRTIEGPDGRFYAHVGMPRNVEAQNVANAISTFQTKVPRAVSPKLTAAESAKLAEDIAKQLGE